MLLGGGDGGFASIGSLIGLVAFINALLPSELRDLLRDALVAFLPKLFFLFRRNTALIDVHEWINGSSTNEIYELVDLHVGTLTSGTRLTSRHLDLSRAKNAAKPKFGLASGERVVELYRGVPFTWIREATSDSRRYERERRWFTLAVDAKHLPTLVPEYLEYVVRSAEEVQHRNKKKKLFTNFNDWEYRKRPWRSVPFDHPATFESIAMDPELKSKLKDDLLAFMNGEAYFRKVGRAWKRGYLLYGPPGTGKSSLIAAISNFTGYDIYDLELADVKNNSTLRQFMTTISNKAIIVIEDIDCSLSLKKRPGTETKKSREDGKNDTDESETDDDDNDDEEKSKVTLSGLLNVTDGLWSSTGTERILIFTTNHIEQLDPALIRSGRMDVHIHLSYCGFPAFKVLAQTHLDLKDHQLFPTIEELISEAEVTPADIAELFTQSRSNATPALESLIAVLRGSKAKKAGTAAGAEAQSVTKIAKEKIVA